MPEISPEAQRYRFNAIGILHSPFKEKFGIPRQSGLLPVEAELELLPPYASDEAVRGLERVSHIWLLFVFHDTPAGAWSPTVRPPRLGGNQRMGVFATRSPFRPNPIGMSVVELLGIQHAQGRLILKLRGADLLDGTPVIDIKPYVPYADSLPEALTGFADCAPEHRLQVRFSEQAEKSCAKQPELRALIIQVLELDPRPAYQREEETEREYGIRLFDRNVRWSVSGAQAHVMAIEP
jgi:tRNA-Thr(GGU) m(6)t(6)A37 methyltransferase TsaA